MSSQYFGQTTESGAAQQDWNSVCFYNDDAVIAFACPGSGTFNVTELSAYVTVVHASGKFRVAIYDEAGTTLIAQGSAAVTPASGPSWQGHVGAANISPSDATVTGGVHYLLAVGTGDSYDVGLYSQVLSNSGEYIFDDFTVGFPASLTTQGNYGQNFLVRCGVDQAGGSSLDGVRPAISRLVSPPAIIAIAGSTCWGHSTGVTQDNIRKISAGWSGTAAISGSGDAEKVEFDASEYIESEPIYITGSVTIAINSYAAGNTVTIKYRTAATRSGLTGGWTTYSAAFDSLNWVDIRLER